MISEARLKEIRAQHDVHCPCRMCGVIRDLLAAYDQQQERIAALERQLSQIPMINDEQWKQLLFDMEHVEPTEASKRGAALLRKLYPDNK